MNAVSVRQLTDMQQAFVFKMLSPGMTQTEAARQAGFKNPSIDGCRLVRIPHVVAALQRERMAQIEVEGGNLAYATLKDCCDPKYPGSVRVSAAKVLASMAGMVKAEAIADRKQLQEMTADELEDQLAKIDQALSKRAEAAKPINGTIVTIEHSESAEPAR